MIKFHDIIIYETEKELYSDYEKHALYNYPIKCKKCKSNVSINPLNTYYNCNCRKFNTKFSIGIRCL